MQIFVVQASGHTATLDCREGDGVDGLLHQLESARGAREWEVEDESERSRLVFGGFQLREDDKRSLEELGLKEGSTVTELLSVQGGGGDGGTKAIQRKYLQSVQLKKVDVKRDMEEELRTKWHNCAVSGKPLVAPIVACEMGFIFIKEEILKSIISKTLPGAFSHIRKMKDLFELNLTENGEFDNQEAVTWQGGGAQIGTKDRYQCPVTGRPANGRNSFVALRPCGHCISDGALKQLGGGECVVCSTPFDKDKDMISLNQTPDNLVKARKALTDSRAAEKEARAASAAEGGESKKRSGISKEESAAKKAKIQALVGAGSSVKSVNGALSSSITKSAQLGIAAHAATASADPVYKSMFKDKKKKGDNDGYTAPWGQGAMAGVFGGRC
mmetsp:Transcript_67950/g.162245  ORF Transcript_67950/g.162245 Transcript_67950/m.162245 type:complete len:386 (-) Transcript_67950:140-1297(-)